MSTFLFVVPPLAGHITPLVAVAGRLRERGHRVVWSGEESIVRRLAGPDAEVHPCLAGPVDVDVRGAELRGYAGVRFLWEEFLVPLAEATYPAVAEAAVRSAADVLVCDMQALAGPLAAARLGRPWATSATTSGPLRDTFAATPKVQRWFDDLLDGLIARTAGGSAAGGSAAGGSAARRERGRRTADAPHAAAVPPSGHRLHHRGAGRAPGRRLAHRPGRSTDRLGRPVAATAAFRPPPGRPGRAGEDRRTGTGRRAGTRWRA